MILEFGGQGGDEHFGISKGKGGLKYSCHPWYGMDIFWNHPFKIGILTSLHYCIQDKTTLG